MTQTQEITIKIPFALFVAAGLILLICKYTINAEISWLVIIGVTFFPILAFGSIILLISLFFLLFVIMEGFIDSCRFLVKGRKF